MCWACSTREPLINSVGHPTDGPPVNLAISPDGSKIAYTLVGIAVPGRGRLRRAPA